MALVWIFETSIVENEELKEIQGSCDAFKFTNMQIIYLYIRKIWIENPMQWFNDLDVYHFKCDLNLNDINRIYYLDFNLLLWFIKKKNLNWWNSN